MTTTFTTPHAGFVDALSDALLATSKPGSYVPILECIHLAGDQGAESVTLTGTDRFSGNCSPIDLAREVMGIDWTNRQELAKSIPPYYTGHIGRALVGHIAARAAA